MTVSEYADILDTIEKLEDQEKRNCKGYCELNPSDRLRRENAREIYLAALLNVRTSLKQICKVN